MESFKVTTTLEQSDWQALVQALGLRLRERMREDGNLLLRWLPFLSWIGFVALGFVIAQAWPRLIQPLSVFVAVALFVTFWWVIALRQRRLMRPANDGIFIGRTEFEFTPDGFNVNRATSQTRNSWSIVREVSRTATHVFLWVDHVTAYTFRVADVPPPLSADESLARIRGFMSAARSVEKTAGSNVSVTATAPSPELNLAAAPVSAAGGNARPSLRQELSALLRVELRREVDPNHLHGRDLTILAGALLSIGLWIGLDRLNYGRGAEFMWYGLSGLGTMIVTALALAWILSRLSTPTLPLRRTLLLVVATSPVFVLGVGLAAMLGRTAYYLLSMATILVVCELVRTGLRAMTGSRQFRATGAAFLCLVFAFFSSAHFYFSPGVWYEPDPEDDPFSPASAEREQLLFEQAPRIDAEVAAMRAGDQQPSAWFVGFAGYGYQRVFAEEISTAARVFDAKYSSRDRQLLLVNDRRDQKKHPFASVTALRHGLLAMGRRMNVEHDVLFLALSSHGSEDGTISVSSDPGMFWRDLSATDLRAMLDESGIRWRVIVVSACHAGSFIDALADEHTIVLTAAAKENTSFGCSDERDLTYFGEAFFRDALPQATSLRTAFEKAREIITERERVEGIEPSDPQAHFGALLEAKLAGMEKPGPGTYSSSVAPIR